MLVGTCAAVQENVCGWVQSICSTIVIELIALRLTQQLSLSENKVRRRWRLRGSGATLAQPTRSAKCSLGGDSPPRWLLQSSYQLHLRVYCCSSDAAMGENFTPVPGCIQKWSRWLRGHSSGKGSAHEKAPGCQQSARSTRGSCDGRADWY